MNKHFGSLAAAGLLALTLVPQAGADQWNKKTDFTFKAPVEVPGTILPAGKYVFKLLGSKSDRNIVQIFNADGSQLEATVLAVPDKHLQASGKTIVTFSERPGNSPEALKAWFYPGDRYGEKFVYPHDRAMELAKSNKEPVFSTRSDISSHVKDQIRSDQDEGAKGMRSAPVMSVSPTGEEVDIFVIRPGTSK